MQFLNNWTSYAVFLSVIPIFLCFYELDQFLICDLDKPSSDRLYFIIKLKLNFDWRKDQTTDKCSANTE